MSERIVTSIVDCACPQCGPSRRSHINRIRKVRREWHSADGSFTWNCVRCGSSGTDDRGAGRKRRGVQLTRSAKSFKANPHETWDVDRRGQIARYLWGVSVPAIGTPAAGYLESRGINCNLPGTIRYLPATPSHPHAMITAFGIAEEVERGRYEISSDAVVGVHLTRLTQSGYGKAFKGEQKTKIMIGPSKGYPIMLYPPNDGMGLCIAEGIENALTAHFSTGLGAIAAGAANRMPDMARHVANFVESVSIIPDIDAVGLENAVSLAEALIHRDLEVSFAPLDISGDSHDT